MSAEVLTGMQLDAMETGLKAMAARLRREKASEWPDLHRLADQIDQAMVQ